MTPESYKAERKKRGSQAKVAALLRVRTATISDRETGRTPISTEAWLALLSLDNTHHRSKDERIYGLEVALRDLIAQCKSGDDITAWLRSAIKRAEVVLANAERTHEAEPS